MGCKKPARHGGGPLETSSQTLSSVCKDNSEIMTSFCWKLKDLGNSLWVWGLKLSCIFGWVCCVGLLSKCDCHSLDGRNSFSNLELWCPKGLTQWFAHIGLGPSPVLISASAYFPEPLPWKKKSVCGVDTHMWAWKTAFLQHYRKHLNWLGRHFKYNRMAHMSIWTKTKEKCKDRSVSGAKLEMCILKALSQIWASLRATGKV